MSQQSKQDERIAKMTFKSVYPHYVTKVEKKGRTKEELHEVIEWLTGFENARIDELIAEGVTFETFFQRAQIGTDLDPYEKSKEALCQANWDTRRQLLTKLGY